MFSSSRYRRRTLALVTLLSDSPLPSESAEEDGGVGRETISNEFYSRYGTAENEIRHAEEEAIHSSGRSILNVTIDDVHCKGQRSRSATSKRSKAGSVEDKGQ